jgi:hypothetical protein
MAELFKEKRLEKNKSLKLMGFLFGWCGFFPAIATVACLNCCLSA